MTSPLAPGLKRTVATAREIADTEAALARAPMNVVSSKLCPLPTIVARRATT
jgi:hypothetical protein